MDELSEEDKLTVERARKIQRFMSQPFAVAQVFTGIEGRLVSLKDTIQAFKEILNGDHDALPENAFYSTSPLARLCLEDFMTYLHLLTVVGGIDDVKAKAAQLAKEMS